MLDMNELAGQLMRLGSDHEMNCILINDDENELSISDDL